MVQYIKEKKYKIGNGERERTVEREQEERRKGYDNSSVSSERRGSEVGSNDCVNSTIDVERGSSGDV